MATPIQVLQALQPQQPQAPGLSAAVLALVGSVERLAAAIGGTGALTPAAAERHQPSWQSLPVRRLRALLRRYPIDRSSLPAPIETMRRAELLEALRQVEGLEG